jgi:antitoxin component YwqK of YwqJK toxin-antitoxin module
MKRFLLLVTFSFFLFTLHAQDVLDTLGFVNKDEAKNQKVKKLKQGKWMELGYLNDEGDFKIEEKKSSKHAGGSYFSLTIYKDDKPSGKVHVYCDGGKLYSEVMYVNGARKYYTNGQVENE